MQDKLELEALIKKYQHIIDTFGKQVEEAKHKLDIAQSALQLIQQEGMIPQDQLFKMPPERISDKYADSTLRGAIRDILTERYLNAQEVYDELIKHGFHSQSKNVKRDVYITLNTLRKKGQLISREDGGRNTYTMKK